MAGGHTITGAKNITINSSSTFGTGAITINANISTTGFITNTNTGTGGGGVAINGIIGSGVLGLTQTSTNTTGGSMTLSGANLYTGATTIGTTGSAASGRTLTVSGANGSINQSSSYTVNGSGSQLNLDYVNVAAGAVDRIGNIAVTLNLGGELRMNGTTVVGVNSTESFGTLTLGTGNGIVSINNGAASGTSTHTLTATGFDRGVNFSTALVRGSNLGTAQGTVNRLARLILTSQAGLTQIGTSTSATGLDTGTVKNLTIVPYLIGASSATGVGSNFVTYDTLSGLRRLGNTDQSLITAGATGENVRTAAGANAVTGAKVFNSLLLSSGGTGATPGTATSTVTGDGNSLTLTSGALANVATSATGNVTVSGFSSIIFGTTGANEAIITNANTSAALTISSPIDTFAPGGGLTKTGGGTVILSVAPLYTGQTTVNQGILQIGTGTVGDLATYTGNIVVNGGTLGFGRSNAGLTIANTISGAGGVTQSGTGTTILTGTNTYTGVTSVAAGVLRLDSTGALPGGLGATGGSGGLTFNGGILGLASGDFLRNYNPTQGTAGTFAAPANAGAGWAAYGADRKVIINNSAGTAQSFFNGKPINFGAADSTHMVEFVNGLTTTTVTRLLVATRGITPGGVDGLLSGVISETAGVLAGLDKTGTGTMALSGASTFTGSVLIKNGTIVVNSLNDTGNASPIGQGLSGFTLLGGTFQYAPVTPAGGIATGGGGHSTNRNFGISASSSIDASGTGAVVFNAPTGNIISPDVASLAFTATGANKVLNLTPGNTNNLAVGMTVTGPGIASGSTIASIVTTTATLVTAVTLNSSANVLVTAGGETAAFGYPTARTLTLTGTNTDANTIAGILQDSSGTGTGVLSLAKTGLGSWSLSGANTYTGGTTVTAGTLTAGSASLGSGPVSVSSVATLNLAGGSFANVISLPAGSTLTGVGSVTSSTDTVPCTVSPGNGISTGSITFTNNNLNLSGPVNIEIGGTLAGSYDTVIGTGPVTLSGTVTVAFVGGFAPAAGNSWDLFVDGDAFGSTATLTLPTLAPNLQWNSSTFAATGLVAVQQVTLGASPSVPSFAETAASPAAMVTVTVPVAPLADLVLTITPTVNGDEVNVPTTVTILAGQTSATFDVAAVNDGIADGNQVVTLGFSAAGYNDGTVNFTVTDVGVSDPVAAYTATFGLTGNNALPDADPDGDGITNAMEYALGISPTANNGPEYRGVASTTSGALTLAYRRPLNGVPGVTYGVEFKTADLVVGNTDWSPAVLTTDYTQTVTPNVDGTTETVVISLVGTVSGKKFARISAAY